MYNKYVISNLQPIVIVGTCGAIAFPTVAAVATRRFFDFFARFPGRSVPAFPICRTVAVLDALLLPTPIIW